MVEKLEDILTRFGNKIVAEDLDKAGMHNGETRRRWPCDDMGQGCSERPLVGGRTGGDSSHVRRDP